MRINLVLAAAGALAIAAAAAPASAATVGSASLATHRSCAATAAGDPCDGTGAGQGIATSSYGGGVGVGGTNALFVPGGNQAWSKVTFDPGSDLPIIKAFTSAPGNVRMNINAFAFQSYTYTGPAGAAFSITGDLHIVDSSASPGGGALPDGAIYTQYVGIWDPSTIAGLTTAQQLFSALFYADCGTAGVYGMGMASGTLTGGSFSATATTSACTPGSLTLTPGQEVLVVAGLQLPVNRGGFADSSSTFVTRLGDDLSPEAKAQLAANLASAIDQGALVAVPEPATWAMMLGGFGLAGAALRRRRLVTGRVTA